MDRSSAQALRELLASTALVDRTLSFGRALRRTRVGRSPGGLLVVGTAEEEPWHFTAHLQDEAEWAGAPELTPTLIRWSPPDDAPAHLAVDLSRLEQAKRGESLLVVAPGRATDPLLERVDDARHRGASVFAVASADRELEALADEALVMEDQTVAKSVDFDAVTHLISLATGEALPARGGVRPRLARLLDVLAGPRD
ncbi:MAG: hypothetical protein QOK42_2632 [Frankiaceae bacterium]|jgi:hypothetical protein|nr:hypothetical protein [Frankiaceae bacterium]MDX6226109.1 hypothetical protein [Frankiales bacterium]MDX6275804.1 hypothetical protein [Frankiales bacterium]